MFSSLTIQSGETKAGTITSGEIDTVTFSAIAGDKLVLAVGTTSGGLSPYIELFAPGGTSVGKGFHSSSPQIDYVATETGTFTLHIQNDDAWAGPQTGAYDVSLARIPSVQATDPDGGAIGNGQTRSGSINSFGDLDVLTFDAAVGDTINLAVGVTAGGLSPLVDLYAPNGALAKRDDHGPTAAIQFKTPIGGTFSVVIRNDYTWAGPDTGTYNVTMTQVGGAPPDITLLGDTLYVYGTVANDDISVSSVATDVFVNLNGTTNDYPASAVARAEVFGEDGSDSLEVIDSTLPSYMDGGAGNDTIFGGSGNDTLTGGAGRNILHGGFGDDRLNGSSSSDWLFGDDGADRLYGFAGDDSVDGGTGVDNIYGGDGNDTLNGGNQNDHIFGENGNDWLYGGRQNDILDGGANVDRLYGNDGNDTMYGGGGNDRLEGDDGNDSFRGGAGNDTFFARDNLADILKGDGGSDSAQFDLLDTTRLSVEASIA
jgi:Ca2+-binding RTX toxin-like protein